MSLDATLKARANNQCELCKSEKNLSVYDVPPHSEQREEDSLLVCEKCKAQLDKKEELDSAHWACLQESMWSEVKPVQVVTWRMLNRLRNESWAADSIDLMYFDDETMAWAKSTGDHENSSEVQLHRDCNGQILQDGDNVVLTKTLDVKGSNLNAKLGTVVKGIKLVADNVEQIEGKIEGQTIVILTKYLRKG
ncbi:MAG TPA: PhnA domain-containing protein [Chitinophagales bacterium]|nr:PhnA domain-containing protein [Chitinophagales bacterium]